MLAAERMQGKRVPIGEFEFLRRPFPPELAADEGAAGLADSASKLPFA